MSVPLQPVSLNKRHPPPQPRLSAKRDPDAARHARYWTAAEDEIVRENYDRHGAAACLLKLPRRTIESIYGRAHKLGVAKTQRRARGKHTAAVLTPELEQAIRNAWPELAKRRSVKTLAVQLGVQRWWLSKQLVKLGLTVPRRIKELPWSDAETALMSKVPLHSPDECARIFKSHGFSRTPAAIMVRAKRLDLSRRYNETLSAGRAASIIGVDSKAITARCINGEIKAGRRGSNRLSQQGGDAWAIEHAEFRRWILDNLESVDIRKVDKFAFVDLLVGEPPKAEGADR